MLLQALADWQLRFKIKTIKILKRPFYTLTYMTNVAISIATDAQ